MVPAAAVAYRRSVARGDGELDFAAVVEAVGG
jgi:hypothetical protein